MEFNHKNSKVETGKTAYTVDFYERRARLLLDWCERTHNLQWQADAALACRLIVGGRWDKLSRATKRLYRASLISFMMDAGEGDAVAYMQNIDSSVDGPEREPRVKREKRLTHDDMSRIIKHLDIANSEIDRMVLRLLYSGLITGLRPGEWRTATFEYESGVGILTVKNSKNSHGRAHGDFRTLILSDLDDAQGGVIADLVRRSSEKTEAEYESIIDRVIDRLGGITKRIWPLAKSRPSLYSARHQFAADAKKAGMDRVTLAALMGHASTGTAARYYGIKRDGGSGHGVTVTAIPEDKARVILAEARNKSASSNDPGVHF